jgi:hypothetical protein
MTAGELPFTAEVAAYLTDCDRHRGVLDPRYHPSERGALKCVPHRHHHDTEADQLAEEQVRAAYQAAIARPRRESGTSGTCGTLAGQGGVSGFRPPARVPEPPEPPEPSPAPRQEAAPVNAPLERRVAVTVPRGGIAPAGSLQPLGGGGVGEPGTAQLLDGEAAIAVGHDVGHPVNAHVVKALAADEAVIVHQRDAGFLHHAHDGSAAGLPGELLAAALGFAARGWHVMPVRPRAKKPPAFPGHTAEACTRQDPRCRGGHVSWEPRATTDPGRIRRGWAEKPYNIGIATGPSGLVVVDLDVSKPGDAPPPRWALPGICDGADVLAALCEEHGEAFPWETFVVRTGRGGLHLYFTAPEGVRLGNTSGRNPGGLGWLIDTRAHGGYVIAPGSVVDLPDGTTGRYELACDRPSAPLPAWLATLLTAPRPQSPPLECRSPADGQVRDLDRYAATALKGERERVALAVEGGRNAALNKAAYNLGQVIAAGMLPDDGTAERELHDAASAHFGAGTPPFTEADALATIRSAIAAGTRRPRQTGAAA